MLVAKQDERNCHAARPTSSTWNVGLVCRRFCLNRGGAERYSRNVARHLQALGHRVTVIGQSIGDGLQSQFLFAPVSPPSPTLGSKTRIFASKASRLLDKLKFDVVYGISRTANVDVLRMTDRIHAHWMRVRYTHPLATLAQQCNPRHRALLKLEHEVLSHTTLRRIIVQSEHERQLLQKYYAVPDEKIRTIYNGVDDQLFFPESGPRVDAIRGALNIATDQPLLLFAAAARFRHKGLHLVLRALARVKNAAVCLLVVGNGRQDPMRQLARQLGISQRVFFLGWQGDMRRWYCAADLLVLPTLYEPFPNVHLEALACGTPVLTTACCGTAELIKKQPESGYIVSGEHTVDQMVQCLDHFFSQSSIQRQRMRHTALQVAAPLTLQRHADQLLTVFAEVV